MGSDGELALARAEIARLGLILERAREMIRLISTRGVLRHEANVWLADPKNDPTPAGRLPTGTAAPADPGVTELETAARAYLDAVSAEENGESGTPEAAAAKTVDAHNALWDLVYPVPAPAREQPGDGGFEVRPCSAAATP